ncbi:MAG: acyl-CoA dehydrogenase family protein [Burkholderiaceae bacterium]|nr:acyl-CoA dehydrogenase family protein [Burkholderiaceae bacterium]
MVLNEEQAQFQAATREFVRREVTPHAARWEEERAFPRDLLRKMGSMGLMSVTVPEALGGVGADYVSYALGLMEVAAGDPALSTVMSGQNSVQCMPLVLFGSPEQQRRYLLPTTCGEQLGAFALTEPQGGSDASNLKVRAVRTTKGWRIDGIKSYITCGAIADWVLVFAKTDASAGSRGISAFVLPTSAPGYKVLKIEKKLGQNASDTCEIAFDGVEVPEDALVGNEGQGYKIALSGLEGGRIGIAAQAVGIAQGALDLAVAYAKERVTFGKAIAQHQAVALRLGEMACSVEAARQLTLHAAALKSAGQACLTEASMAKLLASETAERVCSDAVQTLGGMGYLVDGGVERYYRGARVTKIYEGTNDIQKLVISRMLTGLSAF